MHCWISATVVGCCTHWRRASHYWEIFNCTSPAREHHSCRHPFWWLLTGNVSFWGSWTPQHFSLWEVKYIAQTLYLMVFSTVSIPQIFQLLCPSLHSCISFGLIMSKYAFPVVHCIFTCIGHIVLPSVGCWPKEESQRWRSREKGQICREYH